VTTGLHKYLLLLPVITLLLCGHSAVEKKSGTEKFSSTQNLPVMKIESSTFRHGESIPAKYTCKGADINPPLHIADVSANAKSLALIMDDPDAPGGTWVHWLLWNVAPQTTEIKENSVPAGAVQGKNSWGRSAYGGPCPPSGTHRYFFKLYALDALLSLSSSADNAQLEKAMKGHILAQGELMGTFKK
jgi:hypothetical protein